jgi:beta-keto acid cleavage enzyme
LLGAALNGCEHPANPRRPDEIAAQARAAVAAGAQIVHFHAYDDLGEQTLAPGPCAATLRAVRAACPGIPVSLTTSAEIEPDPTRRLALVAAWTELPDLVTANQGERGIADLCELLVERGVGIEAGLLSAADAERFVASELARVCLRALVEPLDSDPQRAVEHAAEIERILSEAEIGLEQMHHGDGIASWAVNERALQRGYGIRHRARGHSSTPGWPFCRRQRRAHRRGHPAPRRSSDADVETPAACIPHAPAAWASVDLLSRPPWRFFRGRPRSRG